MRTAERFPWAPILPLRGKEPLIHQSAFVASGARMFAFSVDRAEWQALQ